MDEIRREILEGGAVRLSCAGCRFEFRRPRAGVTHVVVTGEDSGQFGVAVLDELRSAIARDGRIELFIDAYEASATAQSVTDAWKNFLARHRNELARVHVLVGSRFMYLNVAITQHLAGAATLLRIHSSREQFAAALTRAQTQAVTTSSSRTV